MSVLPFPEKGRKKKEIMALMQQARERDARWQQGRVFGLVYHVSDEIDDLRNLLEELFSIVRDGQKIDGLPLHRLDPRRGITAAQFDPARLDLPVPKDTEITIRYTNLRMLTRGQESHPVIDAFQSNRHARLLVAARLHLLVERSANSVLGAEESDQLHPRRGARHLATAQGSRDTAAPAAARSHRAGAAGDLGGLPASAAGQG